MPAIWRHALPWNSSVSAERSTSFSESLPKGSRYQTNPAPAATTSARPTTSARIFTARGAYGRAEPLSAAGIS